jgi:hypothetical protein
MVMLKKSILTMAAMLFFLGVPTLSSAVSIEGDGALGDFMGHFIYDPVDSTEATIEIELTNTSPSSNGGYLTAFAFNLPCGFITDVSLDSTDDDFGLLGGSEFNNDVKGVPYGYYDIGASVTDQFLGGGAPSPGIAVGFTETFTFTLYGNDLDLLDLDSFLDEMSSSASPGKGSQFFLARFRGFDDGGSNKTPGRVVPIPGAVWLLGCGLIGIAGFRRKL